MAQNNNQSGVSLFFSFFLKAIVIILGLVILAMSAYLIKTMMSNKTAEKEKKADDSAFEDDQEDVLLVNKATNTNAILFEDGDGSDPDAVVEPALAYDAPIVVLNATSTPGVAGAWKGVLESKGYTNVQAGDYLKDPLETSKIVVVTEGTGKDLQTLLPNAKMETLPANEVSSSVPTEGVQAFLIIGTSDQTVSE